MGLVHNRIEHFLSLLCVVHTYFFLERVKGLAYVDFSDDEHLAAAVAKNKQTLLGKRLSIAKSDPKGRKKGGAAHGSSSKQGILV